MIHMEKLPFKVYLDQTLSQDCENVSLQKMFGSPSKTRDDKEKEKKYEKNDNCKAFCVTCKRNKIIPHFID